MHGESHTNQGVGDSYYNDMFGEFLNPTGNEQYHYMLELERRLFTELRGRHARFSPEAPVNLIDLCCGEGTNAPIVLGTLKGATNMAPIHYVGVDVQEDSIRKMQQVMMNLKRSGIISEDSNAVQADVFKDLSSVPGKADVLRLSHGLYYMQTDVEGRGSHRDPGVSAFVQDAMSKVKERGFALMFHETEDSDLFSKRFDYTRHDGSSVHKMTDAAERLEAAAKDTGYKVAQVKFAPKLYFPELNGAELKQLQDVRNAKELGRLGDRQKRWLKLLMFAIQPPKEEFETFVSSGRLGEYVASAQELMQSNIREKGEQPYIYIRQSMQAIAKDDETFAQLQDVCATLQHEVDAGHLKGYVGTAMATAQTSRRMA